jgi:hypothetical protein
MVNQGHAFPTGGSPVLTEIGPGGRAATAGAVQRPFVRGPRTQPGLYPEEFCGRSYVRKKCTDDCRANEKRRMEDLVDLPITIREGVIRLVF